MQVFIDGQQFSYISDYSPSNNRWKIQAGAAFTYPVKIGTKNCFIKRFTSPPPGLGLLQLLKGIKSSPLPIVYDVVEVSEHGQPVIYLYLELIEGDTLDDIITKRLSFQSRKLINGLLDCLHVIHKYDYWFSDLCEKNIFFDQLVSRYTLIDLDSCEPVQNHPSPVPNTPGYIPGQEFAAAVVNFYTAELKVPKFTFSTLNGQQLNLLQLVPLTAKLKLFVDAVNKHPNFIYRASNFPKLQQYIVGKQPTYSKAVFTKVLQNQVTTEMITTLCGFFASSYGIAFEPQIISFKVKPTQVEVGDSVTFSWETLNAENIELKASDGSFVQRNLPNTGFCVYKVAKGQRFKLVVDNISQTLDIRQVPSPRIKTFNAARTQVYFGEKVALSWEIEGKPKMISLTEYDNSGKVVWSDTAISTKGIKAVSPNKGSQIYTLNIGTSKHEILIRATLKPKIDYFQTSHSQIACNQSVELSWEAHNVSSVILYEKSKGQARKKMGTFGPIQQSLPLTISNTTTYTLEANDISQDITITVLQAKIVYFKTTTAKISLGEKIMLNWTFENTETGQLIEVDSTGNDQVILSNLDKSGNLAVEPHHDTVYKLKVEQDVKTLDIIVIRPWALLAWLKQNWKVAVAIFFFLPLSSILVVNSIPLSKIKSSTLIKKSSDTSQNVQPIEIKYPESITASLDQSNISNVDKPVNIVPPKSLSPVRQVESNTKVNKVPSSEAVKPNPTAPVMTQTSIETEPSPTPEEKDAGEGMKWRKENNHWALYNESGARVTEAKFTRRGMFKDGKATVYDGAVPLIIDKKGNNLSN